MRSKITIILLGIFVSTGILTSTAIASGKNINKYIIPTKLEYQNLSKPAQKQIDCLAENMLYEAGGESTEGKIAVAMVTLNRVYSGRYPNNICGVVKQKTGRTCQFSWVCQNKFSSKHLTRTRSMQYNDIRDMAVNIFVNHHQMKDITGGATFYHADYVNPRWGLPRTTKIGRHIFYKRKGDIVSYTGENKLWKMQM